MDERHLGTLLRCDPNDTDIEIPLDIYNSEEVLIGRDSTCDYQILDSHVSSRHLRIYSVTYDDNDRDGVVPFVYAQNLSRYGTTWNRYLVNDQGESFLLSDGDILRLTPDIHLRFVSAVPTPNDPFSHQQHLEMGLFEKDYVVTQRLLGLGSYGRVHMAHRTNDGKQLACKVVDMSSVKKGAAAGWTDPRLSNFLGKNNQLVAVRENNHREEDANARIEVYEREVKLLAGLRHPNIITFGKAIRCDDTLYIFTELVTAGDLFSFIRYKGGILEPGTAAMITLQLLHAIQYIHERNIVHRDIKADNILLTSQKDGGRVILTDFGCAKMMQEPGKRLSTIVGTREYCAPEIFSRSEKGYTKSIDMWALGRVTSVMLVGYLPLTDSNGEFEEGPGDLASDLEELGIRGDPVDLLGRLLSHDHTKRPSAKEALCHSWFANLPHKYELDQRYQQLVRSWKSKLPSISETEPIRYLTTTSPVSSYQRNPQSHTTTTLTSEDYTLFPRDDHVSESSYSDALSKPQSGQSSTPSAQAPRFREYRNEATTRPSNRAPHPPARRHDFMNQRPVQVPRTPANAPEKGLQFLSQVERLHADPQLPKGKYLYIAPEELTPDQPATTWRSNLGSRAYEAPRPAPAPTFRPNMGASFQMPSMCPGNPFLPFLPANKPARPNATGGHADDQGEVYEEVCNPVTGKRKRYIYGKTEEELSGLWP